MAVAYTVQPVLLFVTPSTDCIVLKDMNVTPIDTALAMIHRHLENEMRRVREEIRNYPAPIPACDAQFNFLLEEREAISLELIRARELMDEDSNSEFSRRFVDAFLDSSAYLGDSEKKEIRALIGNENWKNENRLRESE